MGFAALSRQDPTVMKYLGQYHACGPVAYVNHCDSPTVAELAKSGLLPFMKFVHEKMFRFENDAMRIAAEQICHDSQEACDKIMQSIADKNTTVDNSPRMEVFVGHAPAGTSV